MKSTYAQKSSIIQKAADSKATSVHDASSQSEALQRKADMANNAAQRKEAPRPNNTGMPDNLKSGIESLSGFSMDDVRVHYNSSKPATVQALAYTQGTDIHVAPGQEKHLPHEAWHVAQQMAGRVSPTTNINGMPVNDNAGLEHEADVMGEKAESQKKQKRSVKTKNINTCTQMLFYDYTIHETGAQTIFAVKTLANIFNEKNIEKFFSHKEQYWNQLYNIDDVNDADKNGYTIILKDIIEFLKENEESIDQHIEEFINDVVNGKREVDGDPNLWTRKFIKINENTYPPTIEKNSFEDLLDPFKKVKNILINARMLHEAEQGLKPEENENFQTVCKIALDMCDKVSKPKAIQIMQSYFNNRAIDAIANFNRIRGKIEEIKKEKLFRNSYTRSKNVYAYVKEVGKNKEKVRLGTQYRRVPNEGSPSRAGVLIHEASHLCIKTDDYAYEKEDCQKLTEDKAIINADSYRLSAEEVWINKESPTEEIDSKVVKTKEI